MMKFYLTICCLVFLSSIKPTDLFAQRKIEDFKTLTDGKMKPPYKDAIPYRDKGNFIKTISYQTNDPDFLNNARTAIYKRLRASAKGTLDSLKKPGSGLKQLYIDLYGQNEEEALEKHLQSIIERLKKNGPLNNEDPVFPCMESIIKSLKNPSYELTGKDLPMIPAIEIDVFEDDIVKQFFSKLMYGFCDSLQCKKGADYEKDKKALEDLLKQAVLIKSSYKCDIHDIDALTKLFDQIDNNPLYKRSKEKCVKQLFWLGGGSFKFNPFDLVTIYNWPFFHLYNEIIKQKVDSIRRCCENDPAKLYSLTMALKPDLTKFKGASEKLFGYKNTKEINQTITFANRILVPVVTDKDCCATGYPDLYKKKWILNYDASDQYKMDQPCLKPAIPEDEQIVIAVNNISADTAVIISTTEKAITDQSKAQASLSEIGTGLSNAYSVINPLAGVISSFVTPPSVNLPDRVSISGSATQTVFSTTVTTTQPKNLPQNKHQISPDQVPTKTTKVDTSRKVLTVYLNVGDRTLRFPGATRKDVLDAVTEGMVGNDVNALKIAEAYFLANCDQSRLDVLNATELANRVDKLVKNFKAFYELNQKSQAAEAIQLKTYIFDLTFIVNGLEAEPPPEPSGDQEKADQPVYHTALSAFSRIDAPKQEDYVITEEIAKPIKGAPKTGDPSASDSMKVIKVRGRFKVGKYYRFQISAGLAVSTNDYILNDAAITNNALTSTAKDQQISFVIGLHTYPWKAFNMDNSFLGIKNANMLEGHFLNRISIYTGIGIPDPTKNFFLGLSLDLLPGVKITGGEHFIVYTKYQLNNDYITDKQSIFRGASPFVSINLDASFIGSIFSLFK